ncbi:hypothetical protein OIV83_005176 [Microbotryomycetes sp. JL201]|nr:hypothetical protein OIV83_005176 [Microbotryomycetes sp. JL201]
MSGEQAVGRGGRPTSSPELEPGRLGSAGDTPTATAQIDPRAHQNGQTGAHEASSSSANADRRETIAVRPSDDGTNGSPANTTALAGDTPAHHVTNLRKVTLLRRPASAMASSTPTLEDDGGEQPHDGADGSHSTLHRASSESKLLTVDTRSKRHSTSATDDAAQSNGTTSDVANDSQNLVGDQTGGVGASDQAGKTRSPPKLDQVLLTALGHTRDRIFLLRAETEMERFVASHAATRLPLSPPYFPPNLNSYQRLLLHRLADVFGIIREVEAAPVASWAITPGAASPGMVVLVKSDRTRMPDHKLAEFVPPPVQDDNLVTSSTSSSPLRIHSGTSTPPQLATSSSVSPALINVAETASQSPQILRILPRSGPPRSTSSASSSTGAAEDDPRALKSRKDMTLEEREAAYKEARDRIFSQQDEPKPPSSVTESPTSTTSPAVITRPNSAGSTRSRSSAAMSVGGRAPPSEASFSSVHSGVQGSSTYGPSTSTSMSSFGAPYLRPSAPPFDQPPDWSSGYMYSEVHEQYAGQTYVYQQQQTFSTGPNASPVHSLVYPHPASITAFPPLGNSHGDVLQQQQTQHQQQSWSRSQPLPSPALSTSSVGSSQHGRSSTPSERGSTSSTYLMRFADGSVVGVPQGSTSSRNASGGGGGSGGGGTSAACVGGPFQSSTSVASTRSSSSGHVPHRVPIKRTSYSASQSVNSVIGNSNVDEEAGSKLSSGDASERASVKSDENDGTNDHDETGALQSVSGTIRAKPHPSLPAKPTWVSRHSSGGNSSTAGSKKSRASSFGSASAASEDGSMSTSSAGGGGHLKGLVRGPAPPERMPSSGPGSVSAWQSSSMTAGHAPPEQSGPYLVEPHSRRPTAWAPVPPPPSFAGGPYPHPSVPYPHPTFGMGPSMFPNQMDQVVQHGQTPAMPMYFVPPSGSGPIMSGPDLRRPPPRSTALFDPNKPRTPQTTKNNAGGTGRGQFNEKAGARHQSLDRNMQRLNMG